MRTLLVLGVAVCMLVGATNTVLAQQSDERNADSNPTEATVKRLLNMWQQSKEKGAVRKQIELTLENMGAPVAQPLAARMEYEFWRAEDEQEKREQHLATVIIAAKILGKQGNVIARDDYVTEILLAFTQPKKKVAGVAKPVDVSPKVRVAAIDALGRIFAQKAVFLVLQSPNTSTREKNKEALTAVEYLRDETQDLKRKITSLLLTMKKDEVKGAEENGTKPKDEQKGKESDEAAKARKDAEKTAKANAEKAAKANKEAEAAQARDLLLAARNLCRKFKSYQKLQFIMSELEPPIGKDKDLSTRITEALSGIEANLLDAWAPPPTGKDTSAPSKNENKGINAGVVLGLAVASKDATAQPKSENKGMAAVIHAAALAEQKANELSDEMDDLLQRVDGWLQLNDRTRKVILTLHIQLADEAPDATSDAIRDQRIINICAAEALGRVYGSRD